MAVRLLLAAHAATAAIRASAFPGPDDDTDQAVPGLVTRRLQQVISGPEPVSRETASAWVEPDRVDVQDAWRAPDFGQWAGKRLDTLIAEQPDRIAAWFADPEFDGHCGESLAALHERVRAAMTAQHPDGLTMIVAAPFTVRAATLVALGLTARDHRTLSIAPLDGVELSREASRWTLTALRPYPQWCQPNPHPAS